MEVPLRLPAFIASARTEPKIEVKMEVEAENTAQTAAVLTDAAGVTRRMGILPPTGEAPDKQVEVLMGQVEHYARRAARLAEAGGEVLLLAGFPDLCRMRLALLGAKRAGLPVVVTMRARRHDDTHEDVTAETETIAGDNLISCLVCAQKMGADAFGVVWDTCPTINAEGMKLLRGHAAIPLVAMVEETLTDAQAQALLTLGFSIVGSPNAAAWSAADFAAADTQVDLVAGDRIILCDSQNVYYVEEEFAFSEPLDGELDMSEAILDAENEGADVLLFHVEDTEDAEFMCGNFHMTRVAVGMHAEDGAALEQALLGYHGCAIIDARSDVPEEEQQLLAKGYGAVIR